MKHLIQLKPAGYVFESEDDETVLDAALRCGIDFPYSCRNATCATCMGKVLEGRIDYVNNEPFSLSEEEIAEGYGLFCSAKPSSPELVIELPEVFGPEYKPPRTAEYRVLSHTILNTDLHQLRLAPNTDVKINHTAGQYLQILYNDQIPLPFSIANAPREDRHLELHIRQTADFKYTQHILEAATVGATLKLRGPYGRMVLQQHFDKPMIFVAGGTGFVPFKALLESALQGTQTLYCYWGARSADQLYERELCEEWARQYPHFHFVPVLLEPDQAWQGRSGYVHEAVLADFADLSPYQIFASGPSEMVMSAKKAFLAQGMHPFFMFSDAFE